MLCLTLVTPSTEKGVEEITLLDQRRGTGWGKDSADDPSTCVTWATVLPLNSALNVDKVTKSSLVEYLEGEELKSRSRDGNNVLLVSGEKSVPFSPALLVVGAKGSIPVGRSTEKFPLNGTETDEFSNSLDVVEDTDIVEEVQLSLSLINGTTVVTIFGRVEFFTEKVSLRTSPFGFIPP